MYEDDWLEEAYEDRFQIDNEDELFESFEEGEDEE